MAQIRKREFLPLFEEKKREERQKRLGMAKTVNFSIKRSGDSEVKLQGQQIRRKGKFGFADDIFAMTPSFLVVEVNKSTDGTLEFNVFCSKEHQAALKDTLWTSGTAEKT